MTQSRERLVLALLGFTLPVAVTTIDVAYAVGKGQVASLAPALSDRDFRYQKTLIQPSNHIEEKLETKHYRVRSLSFPSIGDNGQDGSLVRGLYYQSKLPGKKKLVIVLPIWGAHTYPPREITKSLLKYSRGQLNVFRMLGKDFLLDWTRMRQAPTEPALIALVGHMVKRVQTQVIDVRRLIDWAETQPDIDADKIGLIGFSMGAIVASLALANEPRIAAGALVMGGAHPHEMFAKCFGRVAKTRNALLERFGWTKGTFEKKLESPFAPIDPANYAGRVDPSRVIVFDAKYDTCIPKSGRDAFWHAMGQPQRVTWPYGHKSAFLTMTFLGFNVMRRKIYNFLEETL